MHSKIHGVVLDSLVDSPLSACVHTHTHTHTHTSTHTHSSYLLFPLIHLSSLSFPLFYVSLWDSLFSITISGICLFTTWLSPLEWFYAKEKKCSLDNTDFFWGGGTWVWQAFLQSRYTTAWPTPPVPVLSLFRRWGLTNYLPRLDLNCDPSDLSLPSS
jgi:hypothetical protein